MSVLSRKSKASHVSSILKTTSLQKRLSAGKEKAPKVRFQLPHSKRVRTILSEFKSNGDKREYENLVLLIRDAELLDSDICELLDEALECISLLDRDLRLFVEALLKIKWADKGKAVVEKYQSFLLNLLVAHNYHIKHALNYLVGVFIEDPSKPEWPNGVPDDSDCVKFANVHYVFNVLLELVPMCKDILIQTLVSSYPYLRKAPHIQEVYLHNLLWMLDYRPDFRPEILRLITTKLIQLDVNAPREEIERLEDGDVEMFEMDEAIEKTDGMKHEVAQSLDICLDKLFNYFVTVCHNLETSELDWNKTKDLYKDMLSIFDQVILPTYNVHHVQFSMFLVCSLRSSLTEAFLNYLWKKICTPTVATILRQSAVFYMASLIARGTFVPLGMLKGTLQQTTDWIHSYISSQDGNEYANADVRIHGVFYAICQAVFYVIAFRQQELVRTKKDITFLESLNLPKIVTCRLNPLRVCQSAIVQNFATVTRTYQLVYCYSVIEHNARNRLPVVYVDTNGTMVTSDNTLDAFFPFDPYILKRSGQKIWPFYLNYQTTASSSVEETKENKDVEDDDFLCDPTVSSSSKSKDRFSYGSSPGFKLRKH